MPDFLCALTILFLLDYYFWQILLVSFAGSPQRRVRQRTKGDRAALRVKIMDRSVIAERNVVHSNIMVTLLDSIHDTIQTYCW
jgi:hypothetical protein